MAQVILRDSRPSSWDGASFNVTLTTAPGLAGDHQLLVMTHFSNTVVAPELNGWQKGGTVTLGTNAFTAYKRVLSADVSSGGVQASFSQAVEGEAWCGTFNGSIGSIVPAVNGSYDAAARQIPSVNALAANALQFFAGATDAYPRQADTPAGWQETVDNAQYAGAGGLSLHAFHRAIGAGTSSASNYDLRLTDVDGGAGPAGAGSRTMVLNVVVEELDASGVAKFDVLAEFPSVAVTVSPDRNTVIDNETASINAVVLGSDQGVTYSIVAGTGTVTAQGVVTPTEPGTITVRATSVEVPAVFAEATIDVLPVPPTIADSTSVTAPDASLLSGTAEPDATVTVQIYGSTFDVDANSSGQWSRLISLPPGTFELFASQTKNGKTSATVGPSVVTVLGAEVETLDPPTIYFIASGEGVRPIAGTGKPGATVRLLLNEALLSNMLLVDSNGEWSVTLSLPVGNYVIRAYQIEGLTTSAATDPRLFNVYLPTEPPAPPEWGQREGNVETDLRGDMPKQPITAGESVGVGSIKAPFRTPKAWPAKEITYKD